MGTGMADIGIALRIKYRLDEPPSLELAAEWADMVDALVEQGMGKEEAGQLAARRLLPVNDNLILKAEADTIESLLSQARRK